RMADRSDPTLAWHLLCNDSGTAGLVAGSNDRINEGETMPKGDRSKYTDKQKRQAEHIAEGYEDRGVSDQEAERRAWATVNAMTGGGKKAGSGKGQPMNPEPAKKGGRKGGAAAASRPA